MRSNRNCYTYGKRVESNRRGSECPHLLREKLRQLYVYADLHGVYIELHGERMSLSLRTGGLRSVNRRPHVVKLDPRAEKLKLHGERMSLSSRTSGLRSATTRPHIVKLDLRPEKLKLHGEKTYLQGHLLK